MSFIIEWVTNIIVLILLAIVIDLLLPSTNLQKYVKMVIGLMLILIMLTPILKIFSVDVDRLISSLSTIGIAQKNSVENALEQKKREIQASQRAYILEQVAVQMKNEVSEELMERYGLTIDEISLQTKEGENLQFPDDIESVHVMVTEQKEHDNIAIQTVKPIIIDTSEPTNFSTRQDENIKDMASFLAARWEVNQEKIVVQVEGREQK